MSSIEQKRLASHPHDVHPTRDLDRRPQAAAGSIGWGRHEGV